MGKCGDIILKSTDFKGQEFQWNLKINYDADIQVMQDVIVRAMDIDSTAHFLNKLIAVEIEKFEVNNNSEVLSGYRYFIDLDKNSIKVSYEQDNIYKEFFNGSIKDFTKYKISALDTFEMAA